DKDKPGWDYAEASARAALRAGALSATIILPPDDKPPKWDAADAVAEGMDIAQFLATAKRHEVKREADATAERSDVKREAVVLRLADWTAQRYTGPVPVQNFLVEGAFPLGTVALLAAMGDTGKGMLSLDLALKVASGAPGNALNAPLAFGGAVRA